MSYIYELHQFTEEDAREKRCSSVYGVYASELEAREVGKKTPRCTHIDVYRRGLDMDHFEKTLKLSK